MSAPLREFVRFARERLEAEAATLAAANGTGSAASWEDYRYRCGRINGIRDALDSIEGALRAYLDDDEDG